MGRKSGSWPEAADVPCRWILGGSWVVPEGGLCAVDIEWMLKGFWVDLGWNLCICDFLHAPYAREVNAKLCSYGQN